MKIHIVQQGDTLWKLAKKYNVDFEQLKAVNSHLSNPDVIMPGMKIKIPTAGVPVKKEAVKEAPIQQPVAKEKPKVKEAPVPKKEVKAPPPKMPEEIKKPVVVEKPVVQHPIHIHPSFSAPSITQQHQMDLNFNIYKPMQPAPPVPPPAPPKMPVKKEEPKVEKPKVDLPPPPKPVDMPKAPVVAPSYQPMPQQCYPITGVMPGCSYGPPPFMQPYHGYPMMPQPVPYGYQPNMMPAPMAAPMQQYPQQPMGGFTQQAMPYAGSPPSPYQQPWTAVPQQEIDEDTDQPMPTQSGQFQMPTMQAQVPPMQVPPTWCQPQPIYGDITGHQHLMAPMPPQQPWGYPMQSPSFPTYQGHPQMRPFQVGIKEEED